MMIKMLKEIQKIQYREGKIQGLINAANLRKQYEEGTEEDDELLAVWKDEPIIGNKVDPREYYSGSTSPNPIAEVTSKDIEYVEDPEEDNLHHLNGILNQ